MEGRNLGFPCVFCFRFVVVFGGVRPTIGLERRGTARRTSPASLLLKKGCKTRGKRKSRVEEPGPIVHR